MVKLLNSIYLGAAKPEDYGKAAGVVELLPFDYYLGAAVPSHGKSTINVLLSGVSPLTLLNAVKLNYIKAFGKCEQNGTPTPDNPVDIVCNNGTIKAFCGNKWTDVNKLSGYIINVSMHEIQANSNYSVSAPIFLKAGDYSVSYYAQNTGARPFTIWESNAQGDLIGERSILNIPRPIVGTNTGTFTIDRDMYVRVSWRNDFTNIVVAPTDVIIYYDGTVETVAVTGKNLFNPSFYNEQGWYITNNTVSNAGSNATLVMSCKPNTTYSWWHCTVKGGVRAFELSTSTIETGQSASWAVSTPITADKNIVYTYTTSSTAKLLCVCFGRIDSSTTASKKEQRADFMLVEGSITTATPYEPYYNGGTATAEPLLAVGTYKDEQNVTNGAITRNVGVKVLDGSEDWYAVTNNPYIYGLAVANGTFTRNVLAMSTHYVGTVNTNPNMVSGTIKATHASILAPNKISVYIKDTTNGTSLTDFKAYLADQYANGTPVIVVYPLVTPTTETVTGQPLTIQAGTNTITASGSVDGLELEVSYKAYAKVTVEEIEAVNTDENVEVTIG